MAVFFYLFSIILHDSSPSVSIFRYVERHAFAIYIIILNFYPGNMQRQARQIRLHGLRVPAPNDIHPIQPAPITSALANRRQYPNSVIKQNTKPFYFRLLFFFFVIVKIVKARRIYLLCQNKTESQLIFPI